MKSYTQTEIEGMTQDQLKAALIEAQASKTDVTGIAVDDTDNTEQTANMTAMATSQATATDTQQTAAPATEPTPLEKLTAKIDDLEADGTGLYDAAISVLKQQRDTMIADAKAVVDEAESSVKTGVQGTETEVKSFWQQYGNGIAQGAKVFLLAYIATVITGRVLGLM
ncbi:ribosomal protein L7/L12 [Sporomusaceae bacterium BoRhaA]|uniref:hypothetical protein n=1 Tax=Pelorhabdus rhamnosifermentans TaxID=2772457 RepID=UPI001C0622AA|nr:hypothetical protein [Pelorhabdus rhamnosifermentans]MBU2701704.1 ribosomal protein L7/L12 [Pelorhabdus rhamnosifermentans]